MSFLRVPGRPFVTFALKIIASDKIEFHHVGWQEKYEKTKKKLLSVYIVCHAI